MVPMQGLFVVLIVQPFHCTRLSLMSMANMSHTSLVFMSLLSLWLLAHHWGGVLVASHNRHHSQMFLASRPIQSLVTIIL
jgi:hypothetical protein